MLCEAGKNYVEGIIKEYSKRLTTELRKEHIGQVEIHMNYR